MKLRFVIYLGGAGIGYYREFSSLKEAAYFIKKMEDQDIGAKIVPKSKIPKKAYLGNIN